MMLSFLTVAMALLMPSTPTPRCRRATAAMLSALQSVPLQVRVDQSSGSRELLTFERLMKVKPFPLRCPYDGIELFGAAEPLQLQPQPSRAVTSALSRLYRALLGWKPTAVLEHVCDGTSRLPQRVLRGRGSWQLHGSADSLAFATESSRNGLQHCQLPDLRIPTRSNSEPSYALPFDDGQFGVVMSHHCVPYAVAPLPLFEELRRVLKPGGTLCLTFQGPPPQDPRSGGDKSWAFHAAADPRSASLAWLQAADGADLLYMVASFFFYSGGWAQLEVTELLPHSPASPSPLYALVATKLSNRESFVLRASNDPGRSRATYDPEGAYDPDAADVDASAAAASSSAAGIPFTLPPPPPPPSAADVPPPAVPSPAARPTIRQIKPLTTWQPPPATRKLQEAARAARRAAGAGGAKSDSRVGKAENAQLTFRAAQRPQPGEASTRTTSAGADASALVRRKILETIKRGIAANSDRTDLEEGERRMLEHMQLYVMETSVAESQLSDDEAEAWEQMKASYLRGTKEQA